MVFVASKLVSNLLDYPSDIFVCELCVADLDGLPEFELLAKLVVLARRNFEYATKGERVTA